MIILSKPTNEDIFNIYESYRKQNEPDSPTIDYLNLSEKALEDVRMKFKKHVYVTIVDLQKVGWVTFLIEDDAVNLGFALFKEFRGKRLMTQIIKKAICDFETNFPEKAIICSTREENIPAVKTIIKAGFTRVGTSMRSFNENSEKKTLYIDFKYVGKL